MGMSQKILHRLSQTTNLFGLKLWAVVTICTAMVVLVTVFVVWVWGFSNRRRPKLSSSSHHCKLSSSKAAQRIGADNDDDDDGKKNKENKKVKIQVLESSQQRPSPVSVDVTISQQKKEMQGKYADGTMDSSSAVVQNHCKSLFKGAFSWTQVVALGPRSVSGDVSPMMMMHRNDDEMHPGAPVALPFLQKQSEMAVAAAAVADESSDMFASQSVPRNESSWTDESSSRTGSRSSWSADFPGGGGGAAAAAGGGGSDLGWGQWYTLQEIETATHGFAEDTLLGEGGYGIVYRGELPNGTLVAVKNLLNNKSVTISPSVSVCVCVCLYLCLSVSLQKNLQFSNCMILSVCVFLQILFPANSQIAQSSVCLSVSFHNLFPTKFTNCWFFSPKRHAEQEQEEFHWHLMLQCRGLLPICKERVRRKDFVLEMAARNRKRP
jgi:hypothetical protein